MPGKSQATQALQMFNSATKTVSVAVVAARFGAKKRRFIDEFFGNSRIEFEFPAGSVLITKGRGRNHQFWTALK